VGEDGADTAPPATISTRRIVGAHALLHLLDASCFSRANSLRKDEQFGRCALTCYPCKNYGGLAPEKGCSKSAPFSGSYENEATTERGLPENLTTYVMLIQTRTQKERAAR
jgi:hypothetical protein